MKPRKIRRVVLGEGYCDISPNFIALMKNTYLPNCIYVNLRGAHLSLKKVRLVAEVL